MCFKNDDQLLWWKAPKNHLTPFVVDVVVADGDVVVNVSDSVELVVVHVVKNVEKVDVHDVCSCCCSCCFHAVVNVVVSDEVVVVVGDIKGQFCYRFLCR